MELIVNLSFHYYDENGKEITEEIEKRKPIQKALMEQLYIPARSLFVEALNPHYEEWNNEFDEKYPEKDGYSQEYCDFLTERQREVIQKVNNPVKAYLDFDVIGDPEDDFGDLYAKVNRKVFGKPVNMRVALIPVE